jgi:aspartate aminotransferase-like enzyme
MKIIITGTTGMIGEGVLLECLDHQDITEILSVSRKPCGKSHPKLKEYIVPSFLDLKPNDDSLQNYDACFFCAGVSSIGKDEAEFTKLTYDTTITFAKAIGANPHSTFIYVSGSGTDSTEKGSQMWARVKGKTENDLMKMPFKKAFGYRIGAVTPTKLQSFVLPYYRYLSWLVPIWKFIAPNSINSMEQVANSMIKISKEGYKQNIIFVKDIHAIAQD